MNDQELRATIKAAQGGDLKARNKAIEASTSMIRTIVSRFASHVNREDLIDDMCQQAIFGSNGKGGVARAIQLYKTDGPDVFSTFAAFWILLECRAMILPSTMSPGQHRTRQRNRKRGEALERAIAAGEVQESSVTAIRESLPHNFEKMFNEDYDTLGVLGELAANEDEVASMIDGNVQRARFMAALDSLPLEEKYVISARCGLHDGAVRTYQEIANQLNMHRLKVRNIEKRAIEKLKKHPLCQVTPLA